MLRSDLTVGDSSHESASSDHRALYNDKSAELIAELYAGDAKTFGYTFDGLR